MARVINPAALREIRTLLGIGQTELARRVDSHQSTIAHLEDGSRNGSPEMMRKLADALGCPLDAITIPVRVPEPEPEAAA